MIAASPPKSSHLPCSKILHKSPVLHPLARFVTEETVALLFNISPDKIYRIDCYRHVVYVHAKGISRFVSYADFPPLVGVALPNGQDFWRWRKRWKGKIAPEFWVNFYIYQFKNAFSFEHLREWGMLVGKIKSEFSQEILQDLRDVYAREKSGWENF
jgi:hypothetical protein